MKDEIMQTFRESADLKVRFIRQNAEVLGQAVGMVVEAFKAGNKVLLFGNGGSAADAQHIAAEFVNRYQIEPKKIQMSSSASGEGAKVELVMGRDD